MNTGHISMFTEFIPKCLFRGQKPLKENVVEGIKTLQGDGLVECFTV